MRLWELGSRLEWSIGRVRRRRLCLDGEGDDVCAVSIWCSRTLLGLSVCTSRQRNREGGRGWVGWTLGLWFDSRRRWSHKLGDSPSKSSLVEVIATLWSIRAHQSEGIIRWGTGHLEAVDPSPNTNSVRFCILTEYIGTNEVRRGINFESAISTTVNIGGEGHAKTDHGCEGSHFEGNHLDW